MQLFFFFFLLVSCGAVAVTAWAGCQRDRDKDHRPRENCTALGFSDVPRGFEPTTEVMLLPYNQFTSLSWSSFQIFTKIYEIDLTGNQVPEVPPSVAPVLPSLRVLRLGSNRLTSLPEGSFSACPALTELYLDNNGLHALSDHSFSGLSKLEILDLSNNRIAKLPELMLRPLLVFEILYLDNNQIKVMPDDWFGPKEEVPYLYLSANPWACSCSLGYFHRYLGEYEFNFYVRDGPIINSDAESVVCDSPQWLKNKPIVSLEENDLCPPATEPRSEVRRTSIPVYSPTVEPSTESPAPTTPTKRQTVPLTVTPTTPKLRVVATTEATAASRPIDEAVRGKFRAGRGAGVFCFWLFAGCVLLCVASAACSLATFVRLIVWYRRAYRPLSAMLARGVGRGEVLRLLTCSGRKKKEVGKGGGGVMAVYRSVLFVHRDGGDATEREDGGKGGDATEREDGGKGGDATEREDGGKGVKGGSERLVITLEPSGAANRKVEGESGKREEKGVYRKTLYRLSSKEKEIEGWRDVMEECRVSAGEGGEQRRRGEQAVSRKVYSVILREEREEEGGGKEELDWVVGGWEVKRGEGGGEGEEPRSSWGEWLAHYLPSMPWGVTTPPEGEHK
ncbi:hypothetical protein PFLUV_G00170760 [Perca fluviatilis]|uniref:LRRCT domain-containing protein n=1 Tax=Perca fluviatilis TaxID=8168 RepID=A0A6A5ERM0_PERFL|nr:hypothetical protein PFLUV_G00170760 [Perca fluviatilis]